MNAYRIVVMVRLKHISCLTITTNVLVVSSVVYPSDFIFQVQPYLNIRISQKGVHSIDEPFGSLIGDAANPSIIPVDIYMNRNNKGFGGQPSA